MSSDQFERGVALVLVDDLGDVDDDDDVRVSALCEELLEELDVWRDQVRLDGMTVDEARIILRRVIRRRMTAGELRAGVRLVLAEIAAEDAS